MLIGTGLTAVHLAIAPQTREFGGIMYMHMHMLSRRGFLPHAHKPLGTWPPFWDQDSPQTVRRLARLVRQQMKYAGDDWQSVITSADAPN